MNTRMEFIDIQWTVVSLLESTALFAATIDNATTNDWSVHSLKLTSESDEEVSLASTLPDTSLGSMTIESGSSGCSRNLFWSAVATHYGTIVTGGLYIGQFSANLNSIDPYIRAIDTLGDLFWTERTLCIVLTLEDDTDLDIGPGIIGRYRRDIWQAVKLKYKELSGLEVNFDSPEWVQAMPVELKETAYLSVCDMSEQSQSSIFTVQHLLQEYLKEIIGDRTRF